MAPSPRKFVLDKSRSMNSKVGSFTSCVWWQWWSPIELRLLPRLHHIPSSRFLFNSHSLTVLIRVFCPAEINTEFLCLSLRPELFYAADLTKNLSSTCESTRPPIRELEDFADVRLQSGLASAFAPFSQLRSVL